MCRENHSRTPPGVRELKHYILYDLSYQNRRTPPGVRELKRQDRGEDRRRLRSHPSRGA